MDDNGADVAAFVARVDRDRLAAIMLDTFRAEIPGYARLPASALRGQVVHVIRQNVDLCLDWVAGGGAPDPARFEDFRESAKNRASEGMPLEDLLRAYRVGGTAAWRGVVGEGRGGGGGKLPRGGGRGKAPPPKGPGVGGRGEPGGRPPPRPKQGGGV